MDRTTRNKLLEEVSTAVDNNPCIEVDDVHGFNYLKFGDIKILWSVWEWGDNVETLVIYKQTSGGRACLTIERKGFFDFKYNSLVSKLQKTHKKKREQDEQNEKLRNQSIWFKGEN